VLKFDSKFCYAGAGSNFVFKTMQAKTKCVKFLEKISAQIANMRSVSGSG
jgi:hypothetical protein